MSNKDWFLELYENYKEMLLHLLDYSIASNASIHFSITPDKTIIFSADDEKVLRTIVQDSESKTYTLYESTKEDENG